MVRWGFYARALARHLGTHKREPTRSTAPGMGRRHRAELWDRGCLQGHQPSVLQGPAGDVGRLRIAAAQRCHWGSFGHRLSSAAPRRPRDHFLFLSPRLVRVLKAEKKPIFKRCEVVLMFSICHSEGFSFVLFSFALPSPLILVSHLHSIGFGWNGIQPQQRLGSHLCYSVLFYIYIYSICI